MAADALDQAVRRADPDRWLASRFIADRDARADVIAVYAFDHELARADVVASQTLIAHIRLTWWREALDEIFSERPVRAHPAAQALATCVRRRALRRAPLESMIDGHIDALDQPAPTLPQALAWADAVGGGVVLTTARVLDATTSSAATAQAGRAWGLHLLRRSGRVDDGTVRPSIDQALQVANTTIGTLSVKAFPAVACATLARASAGTPLSVRLRLMTAVLRGRL